MAGRRRYIGSRWPRLTYGDSEVPLSGLASARWLDCSSTTIGDDPMVFEARPAPCA